MTLLRRQRRLRLPSLSSRFSVALRIGTVVDESWHFEGRRNSSCHLREQSVSGAEGRIVYSFPKSDERLKQAFERFVMANRGKALTICPGSSIRQAWHFGSAVQNLEEANWAVALSGHPPEGSSVLEFERAESHD